METGAQVAAFVARVIGEITAAFRDIERVREYGAEALEGGFVARALARGHGQIGIGNLDSRGSRRYAFVQIVIVRRRLFRHRHVLRGLPFAIHLQKRVVVSGAMGRILAIAPHQERLGGAADSGDGEVGEPVLDFPAKLHDEVAHIYAALARGVGLIASGRGERAPHRLQFGERSGILFGLLALFWPGITALALLYFIAFWAILSGIARIVMAIMLRREIENEWSIALSGVLSVILGIVLILLPAAGLLAYTWLIGLLALAIGIALIYYAFRVRGQRAGSSRVA